MALENNHTSLYDMDPELILTSWTGEYAVGPITVRFSGELDPVLLRVEAYFQGVKLGTVELSPSSRNVCISGKVDNNNKAEVCCTLSDANNSIILEGKVCVFGICKKSSVTVSLPVFSEIGSDSFI
ncbi:hypothetical protein KLI54_00100 [Bacillus thuringiensis]|uniref:hypothetical protein n=1 Tax=Bacillus thuringiensis TaxID=1428 RepID=UPI001BE4250C|nr:hypothetical protein [Bacillus thuringiensis]MBT2196652.1 hypothetical protein [Bacillus thuringiensis]